ncbi:hypothetical protein GCM10011409_43280 [Lentibacillus populi]|uniref:YqaI-like protein n=1 Tax=Lentibacillus populi TaxID=1827502 RepID=A0A9W5U1G9_9BACI|nr:hypothetical protein [Lentibacillus populi]GGB61367.1 hypothetical protein GCM10011409_43280 [Lentibacillus populi]
MNHPLIDQIERTGYPAYSPRREEYKVDPLGNEVHSGDQILVLNDDFFLTETMGAEAIEVLELLGASYEIAK